VAGAGVIGSSIAFHLARLGCQDALLIDKNGVCAANSARSGALVRNHYANLDEARFALAALPWFEEWGERVGGDCGFTRTGLLQLVSSGDHDTLRANVADLRSVGVSTELVGAEEIAEIQPGIRVGDDELAAYEPRGGNADPVATTKSFAAAAARLGVRVVTGVPVTGLHSSGVRVSGVDTPAGLRGDGVLPTSEASLVGACRFAAASPIPR
jgi:glycine/D-amino acid oxidase-like deaminating enzyme